MDAVFVKLLNMSIAASWLILAVIILRVLLKKAPKRINCILWGMVAVRLVCPFSFESILSLIPSAEIINSDMTRYSPNPETGSGASTIGHSVNPIVDGNFAPAAGANVNPPHTWMDTAGIVWMIGLSCLLCYALINFFRLRRKVSEAVLLRDNIWAADMVTSPFILGVIRPKIYLSSSMEESGIDYIIAHEQAHIRRKDHWWKLLGYTLLAVYWFNPLSWAAYHLFCRDIELACDEKVICKLDEAGKKLYSNTLLSCSIQRRTVMAFPLAFGEIGVKERIKAVLNYKKTPFCVLLASIAVCIVVAVCFLTNPITSNAENGESADEELAGMSPSVEWWTYDEYAEWLENEKKELSEIIGSKGWTSGTGWFTWTQEEVDEAIARYEEILEQIKAGYKISKTVDGSSDVMLMQGSSDYGVTDEDTVTYDVIAEAAATSEDKKQISDSFFSKEDYQKLSALQFDDYRHMTISEFQNKVWRMTDTAEYLNLLERLSKDETLYGLKDSDETAWFLFYVLLPLTGENWQTCSYSGAAVSDLPAPAENATLEYTFTLTILNADVLMIKDYNDIRLGVIDIMQNMLKNRTKEELQKQNEQVMLAEIQAFLDDIHSDMQTPELRVSVEYAYFPLSAESDNDANEYFDGNAEQRGYPNGTQEDYRTLLALKTPGYENLPLADFNSALLDWTNENYERMERISSDTAWNDFQVTLTDEELSFVKLTVFLSGMENGKAIQSSYAGQPISPYYRERLPEKTAGENGVAWCSLDCQFPYSISDAETVTVGERDRQIEGMINAVRAFWNNTDIEDILKMSESDIVRELEKIAAEYSTGHVTITINEEQVHFERMDERAYTN